MKLSGHVGVSLAHHQTFRKKPSWPADETLPSCIIRGQSDTHPARIPAREKASSRHVGSRSELRETGQPKSPSKAHESLRRACAVKETKRGRIRAALATARENQCCLPLPKALRRPLDEVKGGNAMPARIREKLRKLSRRQDDGRTPTLAAFEGLAAALVILSLAVLLGLFD